MDQASIIMMSSCCFCQVSSPFTFFGGDPECAEETNNAREIGDAEDFKFKQWKPQHLPYDSSDSDNEDQELEEEESSISNLNANTEAEQFFFFHVDDPELKNRLWGKEVFNFTQHTVCF